MRIKRLEIDSFRGIRHLELDLTDPAGKPLDLAVIAGPNGCGKTTVLEAVVFLMGYVELLPERAEREYHDVRIGARQFEIRAEISDEGKLSRIAKSGRPPKDAMVKEPEAEYNRPVPFEYFPSWRAPKLVGSVSVSVDGISKEEEIGVDNNLANLKHLLVDLTASKAFPTSAADPGVSGELSSLLEGLNKGWSRFFPTSGEYFETDAAPHAIGRRFDLFLRGRDKKGIDVDSLSSGEIEIISLLGQASRHGKSEGVVLLDEPELHLHPAWHRIIIGALREAYQPSQILAATHSPQLIGSVETKNVFLLSNENGEITVHKPYGAYGLSADRVLEDLMGTQERMPEIQEQIQILFREIGENKLDEAKDRLKQLKEKLPEEPELVRAETMITRKEIIGK